ncbi:MAG: GDYXXLXY domain-containing protein [Gammaproteobacteria bacterium]|jgi:uncharacterized membrane-anchored protein
MGDSGTAPTVGRSKPTVIVLFGMLAVILIFANYLIITKERILADGRTMLLELAPRDPRSIMQGDYMALRYRMTISMGEHSEGLTEDGWVVVKVDGNNVAHFDRIYAGGKPLAANEALLFYRKRHGVVKIASDAFYFQEQHGKFYRAAHYGKVRVSDAGEAVLIGLVDAQFTPLLQKTPGKGAASPAK